MVVSNGSAHDSEFWRKSLRGDASYVNDPKGKYSRPDWFWTGVAPTPETPGVLKDGTLVSMPLPDLSTCTRKDALDYFNNTWCLTEVLFSGIQGEEGYYRPPYHNLRHPMVFYYAHPATLYINKLRVAGLIDEPVNAYFEHIFETGVDEMSWDDMSKNEMVWPPLQEVTEYRRTVYNIVKNIIATNPGFDQLPIAWENPLWALFMGFEHERIHLETSSVLLREMPLRLLKKPKQWPCYAPGLLNPPISVEDGDTLEYPSNRFLEVQGGDVTVGKPHNWPSFGWDNEYGSRSFHVRPFEATAMMISNGEFLEFMKERGYHTAAFWTEEGWKWKSFRNAKWPTFWIPVGPAGLHQYKLRLIFEEVDLPLSAPAVVNVHEAKAYCSWLSQKHNVTGDAKYRLLTEVEHNRLRAVSKKDADGRTAVDPVMKFSGAEFRKNASNLNLAYGAECPVDHFPANELGFHDTAGNLWQWCEDFLASLPNSMGVHPFYDDFSTPCYDGQHNVIMGGSFISTGDEASAFARFHFRPHFFQHAGFRIVKPSGLMQTTHMDSPPPHVGNWNPTTNAAAKTAVDAQELLGRTLLTQFPLSPNGTAPPKLPIKLGSFPETYVQKIMALMSDQTVGLDSALEIGCGVGGVCFELAQYFSAVLGVDLEADEVNAAREIQEKGQMRVLIKGEGELTKYGLVHCPRSIEDRSKVSFRQMDACALQPDIGEFDCVLLSNILEKIPSPKSPLARMGGVRGIVKKGGVLVVASTCDWNEKVSGKQLWLSGKKNEAGEEVSLLTSLQAVLGDEFENIAASDVSFLAPLHARKYELRLSNISVWKRN